MSRFCFLLVCASLLCVVLSAAALADDACTHDYARIERPTGQIYSATCIEPGGYIIEVICDNCEKQFYEYKQADPQKYPIDSEKHQYRSVEVKGECAGGTVTQQICTLCGHTEQNTSGGSHDWRQKSYTASTCNEASYTYEECSKCGMTRNYKSDVTVSTHTYTSKAVQVNTPATCGKAGEGTQQCDCGKNTRVVHIPATGEHNYAAAVTVPGNCAVAGSKTITSETCKVCGYQHIISSVNPEHQYVAIDVVKATCQQEGRRESRCSVCKKIEWSLPIAKTGHTGGAWQTEGDRHWRNCTVCDAEMNVGTHVLNKQNPLCTDRVYCTVCYTVLREAGRHSGSVVQDSGDDTYHDLKCQNCSYVSSHVKHTYAYAGGNCTNDRVCTVCGHHASGNASHTLSSSWTGVSGGHAQKCTVSGCSYMVVEAHTWGEWNVTQAPTDTAMGTEVSRCTKCSAVQVHSIPKLTATPVPQITVAPTGAPAATEAVDTPTDTPVISAPTEQKTSAPQTSAPTEQRTSAPQTSAPTEQKTNAPQTSAPTEQKTNAPQTSVPTVQGTSVPENATPVTEQTKAPVGTASAQQETKAPAMAGVTSQPTNVQATNAPSNAPSSQPTAGDATDVTTDLPTAELGNPDETSAPEQEMEEAGPAEEDASAEGTEADEDEDEVVIIPVDDIPTVTIEANDGEAPLCTEPDRECVWKEFLQDGLMIQVCGICGDVVAIPVFSDNQMAVAPVFQLVTGVTVTGAIPENCGLTLRAASLADQVGSYSDAYVAISALWMMDGASVQLADAVQVSVPLSVGETDAEGVVTVPTGAFKLVRIDVTNDGTYLQEHVEIDFTYENGILTFEMEQAGIYLLIPA